MVTSDFRTEVEVWPFRACAVKNTQYNAYLYSYGQIAEIYATLKEIGVEEHEGDVKLLTGNGNTAISRMRSKKYAIKRSLMAEWPKIPRRKGNRGRGTRR